MLTHQSQLLDTESMVDFTFVVKNEKIGVYAAIVAVVFGNPVICEMLEKGILKDGTSPSPRHRTLRLKANAPLLLHGKSFGIG